MKTLNHDTIKLRLAEIIQQATSSLNSTLTVDFIYSQLGMPPDANFGHYAFPCFALSKELKSAPNNLAEQVSAAIPSNDLADNIQAVGPYVNLKLSSKFLGESVAEEVLSGQLFKRKVLSNPLKTMIEYSQPNTHKELHVGHMRNLCLGDSLIKLHQYCGFDIISSTFPGDVGTHVAKCLWFLKYHNNDPIPTENKGAWLGTLYTKGHLKLESEAGTLQEEISKNQMSEILTELENQQGESYEMWKETREWSIELMEKVYNWANVEFDRWYWESEVDVPSVEYVNKNLNNGLFIKSKGAVGVDLSAYNLGFCMLLKSDGHGLYATKDVELARRKFEDFKIEKSVYIVDKRQAHHFAQVFKVLELMGFENAKNCFHLEYDYVELPDGAMSSRKGNIVPIMDLIEQMHETVKQNYLQRYVGEWEESEIENTADIISKGAIKYGMTKIDPNRKIVFDMKEWLKIDGDSGTYLQYTYARINSLTKKLAGEVSAMHDWSYLNEEIEKNILVKLSEFNGQVVQACLDYKPNIICNYLYELCKLYNNFYNLLSIKRTEDETLKSSRLALTKCVGIALYKGLELLGIPVPERM
ncbi:MAG TPA: arginine--tRNA ligase [Saprospiraceae bacterium]|nr:arginine--tRNA ligase [Saprospiraceae bacterium]